jgi:hypothetical protein
MDKVVAVMRSFEDAERAEKAYYQGLTPLERLAIMLELNRQWSEPTHAETPPGFQRVYRIVKLK